MARRIEVELTSSRDDGTWTWRAAGARQPKGELDGGLLFPGAKVGDVVKVEAEFHLDGIEVTTVFAPKAAKPGPEVLELIGRPVRDDELVTATRSRRREGGGRGEGRRGRREGMGRDGGSDRDGAGRRQGGDRDRPRRDRSEADARPKPKRLRPRRTHRDAVLADVPEEHRPIAQRVLSGGIPEVRKALEEQNAAARAEGKPEQEAGPVLAIAEELLPRLRTAEWRDRADAALADLDELDLRDLRSVVVAADAAARDDESRALAEQLREGLNRRVEADHNQWMEDLGSAVQEGRVVRALRLSSRPVKAGAPLPQEVAATLAEQASAALAADISQERWATVLDAVAFSPVRGAITPAGIPTEPSAELREAVVKVADRVPHIATLFGVDPAEAARTRTRNRRARTRKPDTGRSAPAAGASPGSSEPAAADAAAAPESAVTEAPPTTAEAPATTEAPATADAVEAPATTEAPATADAVETPAPAEAPTPAATADAPASAEAPMADAPAGDAAEAQPPVADEGEAVPTPAADTATTEVTEAPAPAEAAPADGPTTTPVEASTSGEAPVPDEVDAVPADAVPAPDESSSGEEQSGPATE